MAGEQELLKNDALERIFLRNIFYRKKYHFALVVYSLSLGVIIVLAGMLYYLIKHPEHPLYFATDGVGRLVQDIVTQQPNMSLADVERWTIEAVEKSYSYDFVNYRSELQNAQKYFTQYGWRNYMRSLEASNNLLALTRRKMVVVAKVTAAPTLLTQGSLGGSYAWKFQMPLLVTYLTPPYSNESKYTNPLLITVIVQRQNILTSYKGLGVVQLIGALATTGPAQTLDLSAPT